jgi:hypothetical protein
MIVFWNRLSNMSDENRRYALSSLPYHLSETADYERFIQILSSIDFIRAKIMDFGVETLARDYSLADIPILRLIQDALRLSAHNLAIVKSEFWMSHLWSQLYCRLMIHIDRYHQLKNLLSEAPLCSLYTLTPSLAQAGGNLKRIILNLGLESAIDAIIVLSSSDIGYISIRRRNSSSH